MTFLIIFITAAIIILTGFMVISSFGVLKESLLEKLSYSWGLGVGCIGLQLFTYSLFHIEWNRISILLPWIILCAILFYKKKIIPKIKINLQLTPLTIFFGSLIILLFFFTGFESILRPVQAWDGWDNWVFRPKVFFLHNNLDLNYVKYTNDEYPLIIPLMGTFGYIMLGQINDTYILFLFFMFYLALGGLFFATSKKLLGTNPALIFTFLLLSLQNVIRHGGRFEVGQADLAVGYFIFAGTMLLTNFIKTKDKYILVLLSIWLGIAGQIKNDGMAFVVIATLLILVYIFIWKKYKYIFFMLPSFFVIAPWMIYKIINHYPSNFLFKSGLDINFDRIGIVFISMSKEFFNFQNWSFLWIMLIITVILCWREIAKVKLFLVILILQWLSYFIIFMLTPREPAGHIANVIDKLYLHLAPIAVLIVGLLLNSKLSILDKYSLWKANKKKIK
jgi:hypothetical protein